MRNPTVNRRSRSGHEVGRRLDAELEEELRALRTADLYRGLRHVDLRAGPRMRVDGRDVLMLSGANYLGLAGDPRLVEAGAQAAERYGCAAGGSRLISGNLPVHEALERELAEFAGSEAALIYSTGYMANLGVLTALAGRGDVIVSDALNHASTIDACRLCDAEVRVLSHSDPEDLARIAADLAGFRRRFLVLDGVYSMDGDVAPLAELVPIARAHEMLVVVDDAHGVGVLGPGGRGAAAAEGVEVDVLIGNLGKAFGSFGAWVACSERVREYLVNKSRAFIFTCGLAPSAVGAARAGLEIIGSEPWRRDALLARADELRAGLRAAGWDTLRGSTHIVPAQVGDNGRTMALCDKALERGVYVQGIRYPSVPRGSARLRFTPTADHSAADIARVVDLFSELR